MLHQLVYNEMIDLLEKIKGVQMNYDLSNKRNELEVFKELEELCKTSGYLHVIAYFCFRDNVFLLNNKITVENIITQQYIKDRLLRTEISTLIGLTFKNPISLDFTNDTNFNEIVHKTENLLKDLHSSMFNAKEIFKFDEYGNLDKNFNPLSQGFFLREAIFYGGESAYDFQYQELSKIKYKKDENWFISNKGYSLEQLFKVINAIKELQIMKLELWNNNIHETINIPMQLLDVFIFRIEEISNIINNEIETQIIKKVILSFVDSNHYDFNALDDFNPKNAYPIIQLEDNLFVLFQFYSLLEALYETPFFWFLNDRTYKNQAMINRGNFTEDFSTEKLSKVFGKNKVFQNLNIENHNGDILGEIDVLVVFANKLIILQAKSKKLTISSRKGNDLAIKDDFKKAIQGAYNQALDCSKLILSENYKLINQNREEVKFSQKITEIIPICVVSDHYPALSMQVRQFLEFETTDVINNPFVMDIFTLDLITEFLNTPLYFLSYIKCRSKYGQKITATHEINILAYHLSNNLWFDDKLGLIHIADDFCAELDRVFLERKENGKIDLKPQGILTKYQNTNIGRIISQIERTENANTFDFGFLLLQLNEETIFQINNAIDELCKRALFDGKSHDLTLAFEDTNDGLTIHFNLKDDQEALEALNDHAQLRKYSTKAKSWFGVTINPLTKLIRFGIKLEYDWTYNEKYEKRLAKMAKPQYKINLKTTVKSKKIGRNEPCICGSGKKYKKCCIFRI